jgi:hypothetical protein
METHVLVSLMSLREGPLLILAHDRTDNTYVVTQHGLLPTRPGVQVCDRPTREPVVIDPHSLFYVLSLSDHFFAFQKVIPNNIIVA